MSVHAIRTAQSCATEARQAAAEFHAAVVQSDMEMVICFCSSLYDLDVLAMEMNRLFVVTPVVGCTTAGEIGPLGYREHGLSGTSFSASSFAAASGLLDFSSGFSITAGHSFAQTLLKRLESRAPDAVAGTSLHCCSSTACPYGRSR